MMKDFSDYSLKTYNTFSIDNKCRRFVEFDTINELHRVLDNLKTTDYPLLILGGGSNLLLTRDYDGTVLHSAIKGIETQIDANTITLRVGSGECWDDLVALCVANGWHGAENLSLIPGDVGASAVQNIGAYGAEAKDIITRVEAVEIATGKDVTFDADDCKYAYRSSIFKNEFKGKFVITYVTYQLSLTFTPHLDYGNIRSQLAADGIDNPTAQQLRDTIINIRKAKLPDPKEQGNAGSFFMNPVVSTEQYKMLAAIYPDMPHYTVDAEHEKIPAGWMIDRCGWKGRSLGRAGVHDKQALVLVNRGGATGLEVVALYQQIQHDVAKKFGINISPEVNVI